MAAIIETRNLTKIFGDTVAVDDVTVSVQKGSLFILPAWGLLRQSFKKWDDSEQQAF